MFRVRMLGGVGLVLAILVGSYFTFWIDSNEDSTSPQPKLLSSESSPEREFVEHGSIPSSPAESAEKSVSALPLLAEEESAAPQDSQTFQTEPIDQSVQINLVRKLKFKEIQSIARILSQPYRFASNPLRTPAIAFSPSGREESILALSAFLVSDNDDVRWMALKAIMGIAQAPPPSDENSNFGKEFERLASYLNPQYAKEHIVDGNLSNANSFFIDTFKSSASGFIKLQFMERRNNAIWDGYHEAIDSVLSSLPGTSTGKGEIILKWQPEVEHPQTGSVGDSQTPWALSLQNDTGSFLENVLLEITYYPTPHQSFSPGIWQAQNRRVLFSLDSLPDDELIYLYPPDGALGAWVEVNLYSGNEHWEAGACGSVGVKRGKPLTDALFFGWDGAYSAAKEASDFKLYFEMKRFLDLADFYEEKLDSLAPNKYAEPEEKTNSDQNGLRAWSRMWKAQYDASLPGNEYTGVWHANLSALGNAKYKVPIGVEFLADDICIGPQSQPIQSIGHRLDQPHFMAKVFDPSNPSMFDMMSGFVSMPQKGYPFIYLFMDPNKALSNSSFIRSITELYPGLKPSPLHSFVLRGAVKGGLRGIQLAEHRYSVIVFQMAKEDSK